ncbi:MAG: 50S ribosomal protein L17 [Verrucomicrobiota bacterium]
MRHRKNSVKLGRKTEHREAMFANQAISLIRHKRIKTTLAKAKALRPFAEKLVTLGKKGTLHHRRLAVSRLGGQKPGETSAKILFDQIAPQYKDREGGYTRIIKLGLRNSDASSMAIIEWVESDAPASETTEVVEATAEESTEKEKTPKAKPKAKAKAKAKPKAAAKTDSEE